MDNSRAAVQREKLEIRDSVQSQTLEIQDSVIEVFSKIIPKTWLVKQKYACNLKNRYTWVFPCLLFLFLVFIFKWLLIYD